MGRRQTIHFRSVADTLINKHDPLQVWCVVLADHVHSAQYCLRATTVLAVVVLAFR